MGLFEYLFSKTENIIAKMHEIEWIENEKRRISYAICNDTTKMNDWISDSVNQNSLSYLHFLRESNFYVPWWEYCIFPTNVFALKLIRSIRLKQIPVYFSNKEKFTEWEFLLKKKAFFCRNFKALYQAAPPTIFFYLSKTFTLSSIEN